MAERLDVPLIIITATLAVVYELFIRAPQSTAESSRGRRRKWARIGSKLGDLTTALGRYTDSQVPHLNCKKFFDVLMEMGSDGDFLKEDLFDVYNHLVHNEKDACRFMGGNAVSRLRWLTRHLLGPSLGTQASSAYVGPNPST